MLRILAGVLALTLTSFSAFAAPEKWVNDINRFTEADVLTPPPRNGIVFVGSSSIRMWTTLAKDFPGLPVINRGFGGSELGDSVAFAERIVTAYQPRTVVLYAGENDINAGHSPESVHAHFKAFRAKVHAALPKTRIIFIAIKPSPSRWKLKDEMIRANQLIAAECRQDKRLTFLDIWPDMLNANGEPRPELFIKDMLHMKPEGYAIWTARLAPELK